MGLKKVPIKHPPPEYHSPASLHVAVCAGQHALQDFAHGPPGTPPVAAVDSPSTKNGFACCRL